MTRRLKLADARPDILVSIYQRIVRNARETERRGNRPGHRGLQGDGQIYSPARARGWLWKGPTGLPPLTFSAGLLKKHSKNRNDNSTTYPCYDDWFMLTFKHSQLRLNWIGTNVTMTNVIVTVLFNRIRRNNSLYKLTYHHFFFCW